jgi:[CysO sulfur-carrier protein]-S-L-cysteine hydrolase
VTDRRTVKVFPYRSDAEIARARLAADGIRSVVFVDDEGGLNPGFYSHYGVRLVVAAGDLEDAMTSLAIERLSIGQAAVEAMVRHAQGAFPLEACGLILFEGIRPVFVCPLTNRDASERRFTIAPAEYHGAWQFAEANGWTVGGIFHSHPRSEAVPSGSDVGGGGEPGWVHVIVGPISGNRTALRAFRFDEGVVSELTVAIEE